MDHRSSTAAWVLSLVFGAGFYAGTWFGNYTSPARHDQRVVEERLRTVFCEQAIRNGMISTCKVD